jgi:hypothetical protein
MHISVPCAFPTASPSHFTSLPLFLSRLDCLDNIIHHARITQRARITQTIFLTTQNLPKNPPHDLPRPCLGQVHHDKDLFRRGERADALPHLQDEVFLGLVVVGVCVFEGDEGVNGLAGEFVGDADDGGFGHERGFDERGFDLGGGEAVAGDVDNIVDAAADPVVAVVVAGGAVAGELGRSCQYWGGDCFGRRGGSTHVVALVDV